MVDRLKYTLFIYFFFYRKRKLVQIIDDLSDTLCKVADLAEFLRNMHPDTDMIFAAQEICVELSTVVEE